MKIAFTIATISYLPRAFILAAGFLRFNRDYRFVVFLLDPVDERLDPFLHDQITYIPVAGIDEDLPKKLSATLSISEISFTLKPILSLFLMEKFPEAVSYFYFDADIAFYHDVAEAETMLGRSDLLLTPHFTHPMNDDKVPTELDILRTGLYNMGFAAFRNSTNAKRILEWWRERVLNFGIENHDLGLTADQMWMSLAPLLFQNIGIIRNPGYNFAYWNVHERSLKYEGEKIFVNDEFPLVFVHFADFDPKKPDIFTNPKHFNRLDTTDNPAMKRLCNDYANELLINRFETYRNYRSQYASTPRSRSWQQLLAAGNLRDRLKYASVFFLNLLPVSLRKIFRRFSLFILRNVK